MGHAFQMSPEGIVPLGDGEPVPQVGRDEILPGVVVRRTAAEIVSARAPTPAAKAALPKSDEPLTGKQIAALVKARLKAIGKLLANVPALERERDELRGLLAAAGQPPRPAKRGTRALTLLQHAHGKA